MDKELAYKNICKMVENGYFLDKYIELTNDINLSTVPMDEYEDTLNHLESIAANIFNAIIIGCQLFDDEERIIRFIDNFSFGIDSHSLTFILPKFNITEEEACKRLKHGFGIHFTTTKICDEIIRTKVLKGFGNNAMFTEEENEIINKATKIQIENDPEAESKLMYLFRGWGTGVSSYGSMTNRFWMYHTPESLSFLFGNISSRDKEKAMTYVSKCISALNEDDKIKTFNTMSNIWDRLVGSNQEVGCILIDRDAFEYEIDYYYNTGTPVPVQRRPYNQSLNSINNNDNKINTDIDIKNLRFLRIPTVLELENIKTNAIQNSPIQTR